MHSSGVPTPASTGESRCNSRNENERERVTADIKIKRREKTTLN